MQFDCSSIILPITSPFWFFFVVAHNWPSYLWGTGCCCLPVFIQARFHFSSLFSSSLWVLKGGKEAEETREIR